MTRCRAACVGLGLAVVVALVPARTTSRGVTAAVAFAGDPPAAGGLVVDDPHEGAVVGRDVVVKGRIPDAPGAGAAILRVNGQDVAIVSGAFEVALHADTDGPFLIRVSYAQVGAPAEVVTRAVEVDATPPVLTVLEPPEEAAEVVGNEAAVRGTVGDAHLASLAMNGHVVPVDASGRFDVPFLLPKAGELRVEIEARDAVGNVSRAHRVLHAAAAAAGLEARVLRGGRAAGPAVSWSIAECRVAIEDEAVAVPMLHAAVASLGTPAGPAPHAGGDVSDKALDVRADRRCPWRLIQWLVQGVRGSGQPPARAAVGLLSDTVEPAPVVAVQGAAESDPHMSVRLASGAEPGAVLLRVGAFEWTIGSRVPKDPRPAILGEVEAVARRLLAAAPGQTVRFDISGPAAAWVAVGDVLDVARAVEHAGATRTEWSEIEGPRTGRRNPAPASPPLPSAGVSPPAVQPAPKPPAPLPPPSSRVEAPEQAAVAAALEWLAAHQSPSGEWRPESFSVWCQGRPLPTPDATEMGAGLRRYTVGVTGLALMALLGSADAETGRNRYVNAVRAGIRYLGSVQDELGCFGSRTDSHDVYNHAIATHAVLRAYAVYYEPGWHQLAQNALGYIELTRNPTSAWRYGERPGDNDTSVTAWMAGSYVAAQIVNGRVAHFDARLRFTLDEAVRRGVLSWLDKVTDPVVGRVGYQVRGSGPARSVALGDAFPPEKSESMTAAGIALRIAYGQKLETTPVIAAGARLVAALPPSWTADAGAVDFYYWYYGTLAMRAVGGKPWESWRSALKQSLLSHQRRDGTVCTFLGSWDPVDPWGPDGGRVYSTAILAMALEEASGP